MVDWVLGFGEGQGRGTGSGREKKQQGSRVKSGRGAGLEGWKLAGDLGTRGRGRASLPERLRKVVQARAR